MRNPIIEFFHGGSEIIEGEFECTRCYTINKRATYNHAKKELLWQCSGCTQWNTLEDFDLYE